MSVLNLLKLRNIRKILSVDQCKTLVQGFIISHLDYCNAILAELPDSSITNSKNTKNYLKNHLKQVQV